MLTLIDKQQVRRRPVHVPAGAATRMLGSRTPLAAHQRVMPQRKRLNKRPITVEPASPAEVPRRLAVTDLIRTSDQPVRNERLTGQTFASMLRGLFSRTLFTALKTRPVAAASVSLVFAAGIAVILIADPAQSVRMSAKPIALPPDTHVESALNAAFDAVGPQKPNAPVSIPDPKILEALRTRDYTVRSGDSVATIAKAAGISVETLISFNGITDARALAAGTSLKIPSMDGTLYSVKRGDSLDGIAKTNQVKLSDVLDANLLKSSVIVPGQQIFLPGGHMSSYALKKSLGTLFIWPTSGVITSPFGMRQDPFTEVMEFHNGIDIANGPGTPVRAAMDGRVALIGTNRGYGNYIIVDHANGFQTLYGHLSKWLVKQGTTVRAGDEIGEMGSTGYATGPHLHFTIYKDSTPVNPLGYLPKR